MKPAVTLAPLINYFDAAVAGNAYSSQGPEGTDALRLSLRDEGTRGQMEVRWLAVKSKER
jgi:hypothetical protein